MSINEEQLAAWERLVQAVTPGLWYTHDGVYLLAEGTGPLLECEEWVEDDGARIHVRPRFRRIEDVRFVVWAQRHAMELLQEIRRLRVLLDPSDALVERLAEAVHQAWMVEKQRQGWADHPYQEAFRLVHEELVPESPVPHTLDNRVPIYQKAVGGRTYKQEACCALPKERHHPDMVPYDQLSEAVKAYDRATVRAVLTALRALVDDASFTP